jgi:alpha-galactosidase
MVGMGDVDPIDTPGTLSTIVKRQGKFPNLLATNGNWAVHSNVWYRSVISELDNAPLNVGQGAGSAIGPELGFGHVMGWHFDEPVLLIKTSIGNRSLLWDCLPPGSPRFDYNGETYAGYGDSPNSWVIGGGPTPYGWYAGKEYDDYFLAEADMGAPAWVTSRAYPSGCQVRNNGVTYISKSAHTSDANSAPGVGGAWTTYWDVYSVFNVVDILDNWATQYANWTAQGFEIAGYVWFQGNKDMGDPAAGRYETNLVNLIKHLRG